MSDETNSVDELPEGFDNITLQAEPWHPEDWNPLIGTVQSMRSYNTKNGPKRTALVRGEKGEVRVWESAGLRDLFDELGVGDEVYIRQTHWRQLTPDRRMRVYKVGRKPNPQAAFEGVGFDAERGDDVPF